MLQQGAEEAEQQELIVLRFGIAAEAGLQHFTPSDGSQNLLFLLGKQRTKGRWCSTKIRLKGEYLKDVIFRMLPMHSSKVSKLQQ